jgi:hypothetical protein
MKLLIYIKFFANYIVFVSLLLAAASVTWYVLDARDKRINTPEVRLQKRINQEIRLDLCERFEEDLKNFKKNPNTFRRIAIETLETESRVALRTTLKAKGVSEDYPISYRGDDKKYDLCKKEVENWLNLPSTGLMSKEEEAAYMSGTTQVAGRSKSESWGVKPAAGGKVALVIGNSSYANNPLANSRNDAEDMAAVLTEIGFEVINLRDGTTESTKRTLDHFISRMLGNEIGFVYLSGHGVEYQGRNYFLPVNTRFNSPDEIPRIAMDITLLADKLSKSGDKLSIVVVDACRSSPVRSTGREFKQGLINIEAKGALIGFSTSPGRVAEDGTGRNSPYTKHLMMNLRKKGMRIEDIFKDTAKQVEIETAGRQIPWYSSNLRQEFALH